MNFAATAAKLSAATLMVAEESYDAQYKIQAQGKSLLGRGVPLWLN
jgi:hypothetical protein